MTITDEAGNIWIRTGLTAVIDGVFCRRWECADEILFCGAPHQNPVEQREHNCDKMGCGECRIIRRVKRDLNTESTKSKLKAS